MYRAIGYYITCDDALCDECFRDNTDGSYEDAVRRWEEAGGFEGWEAPLAIFEDTEADTPTHCCECGMVLDHALTDDGYTYVLDSVVQCFREGKQNPVTVQWIETFGEYCGDCYDLPEGNEIHVGDLFDLFRLLPRDEVWLDKARPELRKHAYAAGWC